MKQTMLSQNPAAISNAKNDVGFWHYLFILAFCFFMVSPAVATTKEELATLYAQAFGPKGNAPVLPNKNKQQQVASISPPSSSQSQRADMVALYEQAFGQKVPPKSNQKNKQIKAKAQTADLAAMYAKAFGRKSPMAAPSKVTIDVRVNESEIGEVTVYSNKQGEMDTAKTKTLLLLLEDILKEHIFKRIKKELVNKERTHFKTLTKLGMKAHYNSVNLSLDLQINPSLRKPRVLSMGRKSKASVRDENKITASEISAFMNLYSSLGVSKTESSEDVDLKMRLESSFSVGDVVFENTTDFRDDKFNVIKTTITYDQPDKLKRFVVGSIATGNRNFQENLKLDGFRLSKEFFLNPELQIRPKGNETFLLETDSEVEVYINNQLHQRFYLDEGIYSLQDIGLYEGANNIRIIIKDEFGKITVKNSQQFYDSHLLKPELSLYAISVGMLSNKEAYRNEALLNKPLFSGYYQRGLTKNITMSLDAQFSPDSYLLGSEAIISVPLGSLKQSFAVSGGKDRQSGYAARFEFKPNIKRPLIGLDTLREDTLQLDETIGRFVMGWTISGEVRSRDFAMLNEVAELEAQQKRLKARLQTHFSLDLGDEWRGRLNVGVADYYDADRNMTVALTATKRMNNGVRWSVGAHYDTDDDFSVNLQVSIPLGSLGQRGKHKRKKHLDLLVNTKDNSVASKLSIKPRSLFGKDSLAGSLEYRQDESQRQQQLNLEYRDTQYGAQLTARNSTNKGGNSTQRLNIGFNTALACIGSECAVSRPINDSFALVSGPSNQDRPIAINNGSSQFEYADDDSDLPINYTGLIPAKGKRAVVPLESYRYQKINIDESTLPNGYDPEKTEFEVFPRYHQGYIIKAGGEPATIVDGILVDNVKKPLSYKGGQWTPQGHKGKTIAFFSNKIGRFRMPSVPAGKYKLELFDYPDMNAVYINVPNKKGTVHDVGYIVIRD